MKKISRLTAKTANKYDLYEESVQCVEFEVEFIQKQYRKYNKTKCSSLREDFCASASISAAWVKEHSENIAYAIDLDDKILKFAKSRLNKNLDANQGKRIHLLKGNSQSKMTPLVDCVAAFNFSYWVFKERGALIKYFKNAHKNLKKDGIFMLDAFGGYDAHQELEESTSHKGFTYVWDQHSFNPVTNDLTCFIHFEFKDGTKMKKAFRYDWRLWSIPEIKECLVEAGFKKIDVYMQGWDDDKDEESDKFYRVTKCDADPGWVAYIIAQKK